MLSVSDIAAEMDEGLGALFRDGLELAARVKADAMEAETAGERARLALSFHRIARSVRQTAALRLKIAAEAARSGREAAAEGVERQAARVAGRKAQVRAQVQRLIWREHEAPDDETLREETTEDLDALLEIEVQDEAFLDTAPEALVARLAEQLGLAEEGADAPQADDAAASPEGGEPRWSSA